MKKTYNKLVRDRIPEIVRKAGKTATGRQVLAPLRPARKVRGVEFNEHRYGAWQAG